MRDIRIRFNGGEDTRLDLKHEVKGKRLYAQKYLVNTATTKGTDFIFPDRGTDLMTSAISGGAVDEISLGHIGNFAAIDTLYFCSYEEHAPVYNSQGYIRAYALLPKSYDNSTHTMTFDAEFTFRDGTTRVVTTTM